jgi:preprotein translocase subunit SecG
MFSILLAVQILVSIAIIALVMLQHGKGADMGAAFGSGSSGTVFGSRGSSSFFTRATGILAAVFFINCLLIASPLVRDSSRAADSIADQLEQQVNGEQAEPVMESLEPQAVVPAASVEVPDIPMTDADIPGGIPAQPASQATDDLPQ